MYVLSYNTTTAMKDLRKADPVDLRDTVVLLMYRTVLVVQRSRITIGCHAVLVIYTFNRG